MKKEDLNSLVIRNVNTEVAIGFSADPKDRFKNDLGLDSLDCSDISVRLEDEIARSTGQHLDYEDITNFMLGNDCSVQELIDYLAEKLCIK